MNFFTKADFFKKILSGELIFAVWFWEGVLLRPILNIFEGQRYFILVIFTLTLFLLSVFFNKKIKITKIIFLVSILLIFIIVESFFYHDESIYNILFKFITHGILSLYFFSQIENIKLSLEYIVNLGMIGFFISFMDPFSGYKIYGNYMGFGFLFSIPAFISFRIGRKYLKKFYLIFFEISTMILLFCYSNRSAILSFLFFYFLEMIFIEENFLKKYIKLFFALLIIAILIIFLKEIVLYLYNLSLEKNVYIRVLDTLHDFYLEDYNFDITNGRIEIWKEAIEVIKKNIIFGSGVGTFERIYGYYSHNFLLDLLIEYGIVGTIIFIIIIIKSFFNILKYNYYEKIFGLALLALWFPRLMFSSTMYSVSHLWMFLAFGLYGLEKYEINIKKLLNLKNTFIKNKDNRYLYKTFIKYFK